MDQPENTSTLNTARDAAEHLRDEAEKTLRELKSPGGLKSFFRFDKMYFPALASALFIIACLLSVVVLLVGILGALANMASTGFFSGIATLCAVVVGVIVTVVMTRVWIEIALVAFKINDSLREIKELLKQK